MFVARVCGGHGQTFTYFWQYSVFINVMIYQDADQHKAVIGDE